MAEYIDLMLECNGMTMRFGKSESGQKREFGITKIEGLEASDLEVSTTDNALADGSTVDGKRIRSRPIHLEATLRDDRNNATSRQRIIKFFNPKYSGKLTVDYGGTKRNIEYELEDWTFAAESNVYNQLSIVIDLICPDPFMKNIDNFGQNMADISKHIAFPWRVVRKGTVVPKQYRGLALSGQITGYRTLKKEVHLPNDGDVPTGVQIQFIASRGSVVNELNGTNVYQKIDRLSEPFELAVGSNYLEYDADENYTNLDVRLFYTPLYLGV